jgi:hypothetical protein
MIQMAPAATEPPIVATEAPAEPTMESAVIAPTATPEATLEPAAVAPTDLPEPAADTDRAADPASPKTTDEPLPAPRPLLTAWQMGLGLLALFGAASMFLIQKLAARKWRGK